MSELYRAATLLLPLPVLVVCEGGKRKQLLFAEKLEAALQVKGFSVGIILGHTEGERQLVKRGEDAIQEHDAVLLLCDNPISSLPAVSMRKGTAVFRQSGISVLGDTKSDSELDVSSDIDFLVSWFVGRWQAMPVKGCVLIGGKSSRMGVPKHLLQAEGKTWVEKAVETLSPKVDQVVISGAGELPPSLAGQERINDVEGLAGPIAGILAVMRSYPFASFVVTACDLPDMNGKALDWILSHRIPGVRGILPDLEGKGRVEPLLAYYDFRSRPDLEFLVREGFLRINRIRSSRGVISPQPPVTLRACWRNVNTVDELTRFARR